MSNTLSELLN